MLLCSDVFACSPGSAISLVLIYSFFVFHLRNWLHVGVGLREFPQRLHLIIILLGYRSGESFSESFIAWPSPLQLLSVNEVLLCVAKWRVVGCFRSSRRVQSVECWVLPVSVL